MASRSARLLELAVAACAHSSGTRLVAGLLSTSGTVGLGTPSLPGLAIPGDGPRLCARQENQL